MFEQCIAKMDELQIPYVEDYEAGTLTADISNATKMDIIELVQTANDMGVEFTISDTEMVVMGEAMPEETPMEEEGMPAKEAALNDMLGGGGMM